MKTKTLLLFIALLASSSIMAALPEHCKDLFKKGYVSKMIPQQYIEQVRLPDELEALVKEGKMTKLQAANFTICVGEATNKCSTFSMKERQAEMEKKIKQVPDPQKVEVMRKETRKILDDYRAYTRDSEDRCAAREGINPIHYVSDAMKE